jgi:hypothetical protein
MPARKSSEFQKEVTVLQKLQESGVNQLVTNGKSDEGLFYIILTKYGPNLKTVLDKVNYKRFTLKTAVQIGLQLLD